MTTGRRWLASALLAVVSAVTATAQTSTLEAERSADRGVTPAAFHTVVDGAEDSRTTAAPIDPVTVAGDTAAWVWLEFTDAGASATVELRLYHSSQGGVASGATYTLLGQAAAVTSVTATTTSRNGPAGNYLAAEGPLLVAIGPAHVLDVRVVELSAGTVTCKGVTSGPSARTLALAPLPQGDPSDGEYGWRDWREEPSGRAKATLPQVDLRVAARLLAAFARPVRVPTAPTDGYVLTYDSATGAWGAEAAAAGGNETLAQTLVLGSVTGGTDVTMSTGDDLRATTALVTTATTTATHGATGSVTLASGANAQVASQLGCTLTLQDGSLGGAVLYAANLYLADRSGTGSMGQITTPGASGASQGLALNFVGGQGGPTAGTGGTFTAQAGPGGGGNANGGNLALSGGNPTGTGNSGAISVNTPDAAGGGSATSGAVTLRTGDASSVGGAILLHAGFGVSGDGGNITLLCGDSPSGDDGGSVVITAGEGTDDGGSVTVTAGNGGTLYNGATLTVTGGDVVAGDPGLASLVAGTDITAGGLTGAGIYLRGYGAAASSIAPAASNSLSTTGLTVPVVATGRWLGQDESGATCVADSDQTYTLRSGLATGTWYEFHAGTTGNDFTVQTSGGDTFVWSAVSSPDTSIASSTGGAFLRVVYTGSGVWRATGSGTLTGS